MSGPKSSAQRAKPSKAARATTKREHDSDDAEKSAYRAMKSAGAGGSFRSARERISARRLAKKSGKETFKNKVAKGTQTYTGAPVIAGISAEEIEFRLNGPQKSVKKVQAQ